METEPRYDVVIYEITTGKIVSVAGRNMPMTTERTYGESAEKRIETVLMHGMNDRYSVKTIPAGTLADGDVVPS